MEGTVKWFSNEKGYGFLLVDGRSDDLFFHISEYKSEEIVQNGDKVSFDIGTGKNNKAAAKNVRFISRAKNPQHNKPYYGKPTRTKDKSEAGLLIGMLGGPVGMIAGVLIGSMLGKKAITSTCLKCGGTGHVTAIDEAFIGFQCEKCKSFWRKRNKDGLTMNDVER